MIAERILFLLACLNLIFLASELSLNVFGLMLLALH